MNVNQVHIPIPDAQTQASRFRKPAGARVVHSRRRRARPSQLHRLTAAVIFLWHVGCNAVRPPAAPGRGLFHCADAHGLLPRTGNSGTARPCELAWGAGESRVRQCPRPPSVSGYIPQIPIAHLFHAVSNRDVQIAHIGRGGLADRSNKQCRQCQQLINKPAALLVQLH